MFISSLSPTAKAALAAVTLLGQSLPLAAHDALPTAAKPKGWSYPFACCSGIDCREVSAKLIEEGPNGYVVKTTGELIPMSDPKIKKSPDGVFHWCSVAGKNDGKTICLFVPPRYF